MTKKHKGFIQLPRDILDDDILKQNANVVKLYLYFLLKVNHAEVQKNGKTYRENEHITSYKRIHEDLNISKPTISESLKYLAENGYVKIIEDTGRGTHIRIAVDDEEKERFKQEYQPKQRQNKKSSASRTKRENHIDVIDNSITKTEEKSTENEKLLEQFRQMSREQRLGMFAFIFRRQVNNQVKQSEIIDYIKKASDETLVKMYQYLTSRPKHDMMTLDEFTQKALKMPD